MNGNRLFLDCDGVLADFDRAAETLFRMPGRTYEKMFGAKEFWANIEAHGSFYRTLPLMPDAMTLFNAVAHLRPTILTGCPFGNWSQPQKMQWAAENFPGVPMITCRSRDKHLHARPGDMIIDDRPQHRAAWIAMGGIWIDHHDAETSLAALFAHRPEWRI